MTTARVGDDRPGVRRDRGGRRALGCILLGGGERPKEARAVNELRTERVLTIAALIVGSILVMLGACDVMCWLL